MPTRWQRHLLALPRHPRGDLVIVSGAYRSRREQISAAHLKLWDGQPLEDLMRALGLGEGTAAERFGKLHEFRFLTV